MISRPRSTERVARVWLLPSGVLAAASVIAWVASPAQIRTPVAWCGLVAVVLTVITSAGTSRLLLAAEAARHARARAEADESHAERVAALIGRLADQ
ncbi:hypothetical protein ABTY94_36030, partial [Streptomyces sp. NPDC096030]